MRKKSNLEELTKDGKYYNTPYPPIQICYTNETDEVKTVSAFETFSSNKEGINMNLTVDNGNMSIDFFKKYFYETPHLSCLMRVQSNNLFGKQSEKVIYLVKKTPMGNVGKSPAFIPLDCINKQQFQSGIIDVPYSFLLDGLTNDLEFDLLPKTTIVLTLFFSHKLHLRNKKDLIELGAIGDERNKKCFNFKYIGSFVVENNSDVAKEIVLLDAQKYMGEYVKCSDLRIYDLFSINYQDVCDMYANQRFYFNSIRIFANGSNTMKQVIQPIEFNSGNKYYPAIEIDGNQFQININDVNIVGEELSSENQLRVTVMPNTRVVYLFKKYEEINNTSTKDSFYNIQVENLSEEKKVVNAVNIFDEKREEGILHKVGKNKLHINEDDFAPDFMRVQFYDSKQIEQPILIKTIDEEGSQYSTPIFPICYLDEYSFNGNIMNIPINSLPITKNSELLFTLPEKGDGANIILSKSKRLSLVTKDNRHLMFPIWFENNTDEVKTVELFNDISEYINLAEQKALTRLPEGVTCLVGVDSSYNELLARFEGQGDYVMMKLNKIYSRSTAQITQIISVIDYTNPEAPINVPLITQSYFSASQFQSNMLSTNGHKGLKVFDLNRIAGENEIKKDSAGNEYNCTTSTIEKNQKISFTILPKTKVALICSLDRKSTPTSEENEHNDDEFFTMSAIGLTR